MSNMQQSSMAKDGQWEDPFFFLCGSGGGGGGGDKDECLSLSDLPLLNTTATPHGNNNNKKKKELVSCCNKSSSEVISEDDFEFRTFDHGMCAADELFFEGQLLPLRLSSCGGSQNRYSTCSLSSSSSSSSRSVSRSQSSSSRSSSSEAQLPRPASVSSKNIFLYAHPSPRPQAVRSCSIGTAPAARRSTDRAVFRLGLVKTPEIELNNLRLRRQLRTSSSGTTSSSPKSCTATKQTKKKKKTSTSLSHRLGCMCGPDVVEPTPMPMKSTRSTTTSASPTKKIIKKEEELQVMCRSRMVGWLEELSIAKVLVS